MVTTWKGIHRTGGLEDKDWYPSSVGYIKAKIKKHRKRRVSCEEIVILAAILVVVSCEQ